MRERGRLLVCVARLASILGASRLLPNNPSAIPNLLVAAAAAALLFVSAPGWAQINTGDLVGTITDPSGAVVPGAKLTITNIDQHISQFTTSDSRGDYAFNKIRGDNYSLTVEAPGFQTTTIPEIILLVDQRLRQDIVLQVGAVTKVVTVQASSVMLDTDSTNIGAVIESKQITDMPLNMRNFLQLGELSPGVLPLVQGTQSDASQYGGRLDQVISVAGNRESDNAYYLDGVDTKNRYNGPNTFAPSPDAIQEFKIERTAFSVEFGNNGAIINSTIKSGTNAVHGSVYEFDRNNLFDARNFFNGATTANPKGSLPPLRLNQFGGTFGGPIVKNKLFYFGNYEGFREVQSLTAYGTYPTAAMRQGTFPNPITNTINGVVVASYGTTIPQTAWSTVGKNLLQFIPVPNTTFGAFNYVRNEPNTNSWNQVNFKMDYNINAKNSVFGRFSWADGTVYVPALALLSGNKYPQTDDNIAGHWSHIFSTTTINELRGGWNRSNYGVDREGAYGTDIATSVIGLKNSPTRPTIFGLPSMSMTGYQGFGAGQTQTNLQSDVQFTDILNMVRGRHTLKVGGEYKWYTWNLFQDSQPDTLTFNNNYTGNSFANVLLGQPFSVADALGDPDGRFDQYYYAFFAADTIKVTSRLTLDLGLRYDYVQPSQNLDGHEEVFNWQTGTYIRPPTNGITKGIVFPDHRQWGPRVGLAWRPFGQRTSVRASYGIYYLEPDTNQDQQKILTPDNYPKYIYNGTSLAPAMPLDQAFPATVSINPVLSGTTETPHNRAPYAEQWGLTIEHQLTPNLLFEVGYDGSSSHKMAQRSPINPATPDPTGAIAITARVPYPYYSGGLTAAENQGGATYNALTARVEKRFSGGFSLIVGYTYSKTMDDGTPDSQLTWAAPHPIGLQHAPATMNVPQRLVISQVYALPVGHGMHYLSNSSRLVDGLLGGWEISGIETFQGGISLTPGTAAAVNIGGRMTVVPNRVGPVNNAALRDHIRGLPKGIVGPYFTTTDITQQVGNVQGTAGRDFIVAPGLNNWDLSLFKNLRLVERSSLQIRGDFFNAWNHTQFLPPNVTIGQPTFGDISSAREARDIQFSLKLTF